MIDSSPPFTGCDVDECMHVLVPATPRGAPFFYLRDQLIDKSKCLLITRKCLHSYPSSFS